MTKESPHTHEFNVTVIWTGGKEGEVILEGKPLLPLSAPIYWEGKADCYSPHDLFLSAVTGCYITTYASMMKRMKQPLTSHQVAGRGVLQKNPKGGWEFSDIYITMKITVPKEAKLSQVKRAIMLTEKYCQISRSVTSKIHVQPQITQLD